MNENKVSPKAVGMMWGMMIGVAFGMMMFLATGNPVFFSLMGLGVALGLAIGAGLERRDEADARDGDS